MRISTLAAACAAFVALGTGAQTSTPAAAGTAPQVRTISPQYSQSMQRLQEAAQRLRESIQAMAGRPPGPMRNEAISRAQQALLETQQAMLTLPPELRNARSESPHYDQSVQHLIQAAERLRQAVQAMARQPAGERRNHAIEQANQALWDTQLAMVSAHDPRAPGSRTMGASPGVAPVQGGLGSTQPAPFAGAGSSDARYLCGGVGEASQERMKAEAGRHDAMLTFAASDGAFVSGVDVRLSRRGGGDVLRANCDGPLMLVDVPDGRYDITATFNGQAKSRSVTLGKGHKGVHFVWPRSG